MKSKTGNSAIMKQNNKQAIINIIRKNSISRAELSRVTGLTRAAITMIVDKLMDEGIVVETGVVEANYGRKPIILDLNPEYTYAIGLDISRSGCRAGIINIKGKALIDNEINIFGLNSKDALKHIVNEINSLIAISGVNPSKISGLGVSAPGPINVSSGTIINPPDFYVWHNVSVTSFLQSKFPFKVYLENNSIALALAEKYFGEGKYFNTYIVLVVNTGVGSGIILNDNLYRGVDGLGGEIGHISVDINGTKCSCGNIGCLEVYASIPAILKEAAVYDPNLKKWEDIVDKAIKSDKLCKAIIEREARYLSTGIVSSVNILEPEAVILTGFINYKPQMLTENIKLYTENYAMTRSLHKLNILNSKIIANSEIISAASIVVDKFFNKDSNDKDT